MGQVAVLKGKTYVRAMLIRMCCIHPGGQIRQGESLDSIRARLGSRGAGRIPWGRPLQASELRPRERHGYLSLVWKPVYLDRFSRNTDRLGALSL